jgi:signal peptidase II
MFAVVFLLDQVTKLLAARFLAEPQTLIPGFLRLVVAYNDGAAWNLLSGRRFFLIALSIMALLLGFFFRKRLGFEYLANQIAIGLVCGGLMGNLLDRLRTGFVIDFIDIHLALYHWPTFNVADSALCIGTVLIAFWDHGKSPKK